MTSDWLDSPMDDKSLICEVWQLFDAMKNRPNTKETFLSTSKDKNASKINRKTFAVLEVKAPCNKSVKEMYRWKKCVKMVYDLIQEFGIAELCMIQSFDFDVLTEAEKINSEFIANNSNKMETSSIFSRQSQFTQHPLNVATLYLHNYYHYIPRSPTHEMINQGCGGHL